MDISARATALTIEEYYALDAAGKINRPATWGCMKRHTENFAASADNGMLGGVYGLVPPAPIGN